MNNLRISLLQAALHWEQKQANLDAFAARIEPLAGKTDLILLPEMFNTGFSMSAASLAEPMDGPTMSWLSRQAARAGAAVAGSFIAEENGSFFNRLVFMRPDGRFYAYDKRHLFTLAGEHEPFTAGENRTIVEWKGWRILPQICYDLRFPVWSRN
nr:nitrilase-related carbon-nitrogen hydrolase [Flavilitoribacter sp.]